jgi:hypothetical protein
VLLERSSQWYFDSFCGSNPLLQFIQGTIAIEILLGDKSTSEKIGLTELLSNRLSFSIAVNHEERSELIKLFGEIYDTRSKIVHRGQIDLSDTELVQLGCLDWLCGRLIRKELELLKKPRA